MGVVWVRVRLTDIDSKIPNMALMRLADHHIKRGDEVVYARGSLRDLFDGQYDKVYGSSVFRFAAPKRDTFIREFPEAILGGTGTDNQTTIEEITGDNSTGLDYSIYPKYPFSLGFTQRGCRLKCGFCVVPTKEGSNRGVNKISDIWRGQGHPKKVVLLDNDFFGQEDWRGRIREIKDGGFAVSINQGINVRLIHEEGARALATVRYMDDQFKSRRLYTAWDSLGDEKIFFRGIDMMEKAGIPPRHIMVYMLIGYKKDETWEERLYRFEKMKERGLMPYPMVYNNERRDLKQFQRWVIMRFHQFIKWEDYKKS